MQHRLISFWGTPANRKKARLYLIVFSSGAAVMTLELLASRLMAPYFGSSIIVWTNVIAAILASLSLGYWLGGRLADKSSDWKTLSSILFVAATLAALCGLLGQSTAQLVGQTLRQNTGLGSLLAVVLLFSPVAIVLGMVSPYAAKLALTDVSHAGRVIGRLNALSTVGSIVGTYLGGVVLVVFFGTSRLILGCAAALIVLSVVALGKLRWYHFALILWLIVTVVTGGRLMVFMGSVADIDTAFQRVIIADQPIPTSPNRTLRTLSTDPLGSQSGQYSDTDKLAFNYLGFFDVYKTINKTAPDRALLLGGGAFTYPVHFLQDNPTAVMDVVEIDDQLKPIAQKYFRLQPSDRLNVVNEDGRVYLNTTPHSYDVIFGDVFKATYIPSQLVTREAVSALKARLNKNGLAVMNIISPTEGNNLIIEPIYKSYQENFKEVVIVQLTKSFDSKQNQNLILLACDQANLRLQVLDYLVEYPESRIVDFKSNHDAALTDDFAPVERYYFND